MAKKTPQALLVAAIRKIWRWSPQRAACLRADDPCYVCGVPFKKTLRIKITKQKAGPNAGHFFAEWVEDGNTRREVFVSKEDAGEFRKLKYKEFKKLWGAQADHVVPVGAAPTDWHGWDAYLKKMMEGALKKICPNCHRPKTKAENAARREMKRSQK